ncbi:MAG: DUF3467 domain-containing protein [bacterium]
MKKSDGENTEIQLELNDAVAQGIYANLSMVNYRAEEFVLDYIFLQPNLPKGKVLSRLILSPKHARRLANMLETSLADYESKVGPIDDDSEVADADLNFSVN